MYAQSTFSLSDVELILFTCIFQTDVVRFDNTYSWTRSKTIHYTIDLLEPEKGEFYSTAKHEADLFMSKKEVHVPEVLLAPPNSTGSQYKQVPNEGKSDTVITRL